MQPHSRSRGEDTGTSAPRLLILAAWLGLVTGFVEGALALHVQGPRGSLVYVVKWGVSDEILWVAPLADLLLFVAVALPLVAAAKALPRLPAERLLFFLLAFLAGFDWLRLSLAGRFAHTTVAGVAAALAAGLTWRLRLGLPSLAELSRRTLLFLLLATGLALALTRGAGTLRERRALAQLTPRTGAPNVLLVVMDTVRADHLSCYGYRRPTSPALDRLAREGVLFENAISASSWTLPSHASLFTGRYPSEHGVEWFRARALERSSLPTLAEALRSRGYRTAAISANLFWVNRAMGFGRGFMHFEDYFRSAGDMLFRTLYGRALEARLLRRLGYEDIPGRRSADDVTRAGLRWLGSKPAQPFFLFLNYMDAHDPYLPPEPHRSRFAARQNGRVSINSRLGRKGPLAGPEAREREIDAYDGAIAYVDEQVGQLLAGLDRRGLGGSTLVVITSDHGEAFGEHGSYVHGNSLYREEIHVPLLVRLPGGGHAGVRIAQPVSQCAIPATVMEVLGEGDGRLFPGPSLTALWRDPNGVRGWPAPLAEIARQPCPQPGAPVCRGWIRARVTPEWHYVVGAALATEVYDWSHDPLEARDLAAKPELREAVERTSRELAGAGLDPPIRGRLEAARGLGYIW